MKHIYFLALAMTTISNAAGAAEKLLLFGGSDHKTFLGCFNCSSMESDSVNNDIGAYGSDISSTSIFNDIGVYGSDISSYSPCNDIASSPPVVVDEDGKFYGYLTLNDAHASAISDPKILAWLKRTVCKVRS